jgi:hypothetical protein
VLPQGCTNPRISPTCLDRYSTLTHYETVGGMFLQCFRFHVLTKLDSRVWHQTFRRMLTSNSNFLAAVFYLPKSTFTTYFKLFTSFLISGLMHATGDYILHQNFSQGTSMQFFLLQAVGITFEDAVIALAPRLGYKQSKAFKLIGVIWVFGWFTFCLPIWLGPQLHAGGDHWVGLLDMATWYGVAKYFPSFRTLSLSVFSL